MLVSNRRSLILGFGSLIVAPALVKASSLMQLRGYDMDPWVWAYDSKECPSNLPPVLSELILSRYRNNSVIETINWIRNNKHLNYSRVRLSETTPNKFVTHAQQYGLD